MLNTRIPKCWVDTNWVADHLGDSKVRIVESNEDILLYDQGHIPGAVKLDWVGDLNDPVVRDYLDRERFESCWRPKASATTRRSFSMATRITGGQPTPFGSSSCSASDARIMNGGRAGWIAEGRELSKEVPSYPAGSYRRERDDQTIRAFRDQVKEHIKKSGVAPVDVRSPQEYSGERTHMPEYPQEGTLRGGHIPTAVSIPWAQAVKEDSTFKSREDLETLYGGKGVTADKDVVAYCRIGERSSHTWFVLTYLLGYPQVRNYDGSWIEWGNSVGVPIEKTYQG